jgi:hypothetical protein
MEKIGVFSGNMNSVRVMENSSNRRSSYRSSTVIVSWRRIKIFDHMWCSKTSLSFILLSYYNYTFHIDSLFLYAVLLRTSKEYNQNRNCKTGVQFCFAYISKNKENIKCFSFLILTLILKLIGLMFLQSVAHSGSWLVPLLKIHGAFTLFSP